MESSTKVTKTITLTLNENEANWLKGVMQNPLHDQTSDQESAECRQNRSKFWHALNDNK